jgi:tRNA-modifying protein YgfZ
MSAHTAVLPDRASLSVSGPDAEHFLQNLVTTDLDALGQGELRAGALLSPQGKILFDFLVSRRGPDAFRLDGRADVAQDFLRRLLIYKLRAKVEISQLSDDVAAVSWGDASEDQGGLRDTRFPADWHVTRRYGAEPAPSDLAAWHRLRIKAGVAESGTDYALGDAFPHDVLLDQKGGVGFRKGCYVGQEVVSRMQHRGTARRRVMVLTGERTLPPSGTDVTAISRTIGALGTVEGSEALAILRIDRLADALSQGAPVLADDVPVTAAIPPGAAFTLSAPDQAAAESA